MSIWTILDWILYGLVRFILYLIPLVKAPAVHRGIPSAWWSYNDYSDWRHLDDDGGHPDEHWCRSWLEMAFGELQRLATDAAKPYVDQVKDWLRGVIGYIRSGFNSMGGWVNWLQGLVGDALPWFAVNLVGGLTWLSHKLPVEIRQGWRSWSDIWENIKEAVRAWARLRYDAAKSWAYGALLWINDVGDSIRDWRDRIAGWIDQVRHDPYGWITGHLGSAWYWLRDFASNARDWVIGWLGPDWPRLLTFARDCIGFYHALWSRGWQILGAFTDDPKGFVIGLLEQAIMDRW